MSITNLSRDSDDIRAAAGLARRPVSELGITAPDAPAPRGPGLFEVIGVNGQRALTNVRRLAGAERTPGSRLILAATALLGLLAAALYVVSLQAQYRYVLAAKHESAVSIIEGVSLDVGMTVFGLLALGLAMAGQAARVERALIVVCALASAGQNYAAADVLSPRSVAAYVLPPVFLAIVVDRVIAVVRRHVLGDAERSAWAAFGRLGAFLGTAALYALRFVLAPPSTAGGLRRWVLVLTPLPVTAEPERRADDEGQDDQEIGDPPAPTKRARLEQAYMAHPDAWDRGKASKTATELAGQIGMSPGTAREYVNKLIAKREMGAS